MSRIVLVAMVLAVLAMMGAAATNAAVQDSGEQQVVSDESFTPVVGEYNQLENSDLDGAFYNESVTVRDSGGTEVSEPADYEWNARNGTVFVKQSGALDGESSATIDYRYVRTSEEAQRMETIAALVPQLIGPVIIMLIVVIMGVLIWQ